MDLQGASFPVTDAADGIKRPLAAIGNGERNAFTAGKHFACLYSIVKVFAKMPREVR